MVGPYSSFLLRAKKNNGSGFAAENVLVAGNLMFDCGGADPIDPYPEPVAGLVLGSQEPQRIGTNTTFGEGVPFLKISGDRE
ncbi:MAG: hypothetical protein AB3N63_17750 [Puniceicoccaceae bacterium]